MYGRAVEVTQRTPTQSLSLRPTGTDDAAQSPTYRYTLASLIDVLANSAFYIRLDEEEKGIANTLRNKLFYTLGRSGMLDWTPTELTPYLDVNELLAGGRVSVFDVSETDDRSRNIAIAYILQSLFNKVTETAVGEPLPGTGIPRPKILLVIEEVHTFVSKQSVDKMKSVLDSLQTISRRGRKRRTGCSHGARIKFCGSVQRSRGSRESDGWQPQASCQIGPQCPQPALHN